MNNLRDPRVIWISAGFLACIFIIGVFAVAYIREGMRPVSASISSLPPSYWLAGSVMREFGEFTSTPAQPYLQKADAQPREVQLTGSMWVFVDDPEASRQSLRESVNNLGGYIQRSESSTTSSGAVDVEMELLVPADKLSSLREQVVKQSLRIESERFETRDVTRESADLGVTLRNLRAEEAQYLLIMKKAASVKDVLQVSQALASVREKIERSQTDWNLLRRSVALASVDVTLHPEADSRMAGPNWRPWTQTKIAYFGAARKFIVYLDSMIELAMDLPVYLLWLISLALLVALVVKILFWLAVRLFPRVRLWAAQKQHI